MADWVHCNACFRQPGDGNKFYLTNCGHIYCDDCVSQSTKDKCKMCGVACSTVLLTGKMKPEVGVFFSDPSELAKKQHKQLTQVIDFQKNHRQRLIAQNRDLMARLSNTASRTQQREREVMVLREENAYLKKLLNSGRATPASNRCSSARPSFSNASILQKAGSPYHTSPQNLYPSQRHKAPEHGAGDGHRLSHTHISTDSPSEISMPRLSVRTPPSGGHMGYIPGTQYKAMRVGNTPHIPFDLTPGKLTSSGSPMNLSPANRRLYVNGR